MFSIVTSCFVRNMIDSTHCAKGVGIRRISGVSFPAFGPENSEYRHFLRSDIFSLTPLQVITVKVDPSLILPSIPAQRDTIV